ncbi:hypothetical protein G6O69_18485 [Pseudenhygromyxa sp. WMMC2535]|uniref:hypothetical protein n=1 Tax=Pseudenhygromyxa sp. WMMC2535 TaxID=2712867 RepID=UPI00155544ED|nr:hypothetical protein [Pseudenhygromyxa sp. WMMC2535]NVB39837.1 hypothetical protein [Pseudenhygromyxa sp. WMMC2535]
MTRPLITMWGSSQVGKTTYMTMALSHRSVSRLFDRERSERALATLLGSRRRLMSQQGMNPTSVSPAPLQLTLAAGQEVALSDVRGGDTQLLGQDRVADRLKQADVILFFVSWRSSNLGHEFLAVRDGLDATPTKRWGLVFTKCETAFDLRDDDWECSEGWWRERELLRPHASIIELFGDAVWPISSFGYDRETGRPAVMLDEFGNELPWNIRPKNVEVPLLWALKQVGIE